MLNKNKPKNYTKQSFFSFLFFFLSPTIYPIVLDLNRRSIRAKTSLVCSNLHPLFRSPVDFNPPSSLFCSFLELAARDSKLFDFIFGSLLRSKSALIISRLSLTRFAKVLIGFEKHFIGCLSFAHLFFELAVGDPKPSDFIFDSLLRSEAQDRRGVRYRHLDFFGPL